MDENVGLGARLRASTARMLNGIGGLFRRAEAWTARSTRTTVLLGLVALVALVAIVGAVYVGHAGPGGHGPRGGPLWSWWHRDDGPDHDRRGFAPGGGHPVGKPEGGRGGRPDARPPAPPQ